MRRMRASAVMPTRWRWPAATARLGSTPASSSTTSAPTRTWCGCSGSWAWPPRPATCRSACAARSAGWSTPARAAWPAWPRGPASWPALNTCGCWSTSGASTATPARCCATRAADRMTLGDFLDRGRYSRYFHDHFMLPLTGAVWSCAPGQIRQFPARYLLRFFANHGMLTVKHAPAWKTVTGGSRVYVHAVVDRLADAVAEAAVVAVERDADGVAITDPAAAAPLRPRHHRRPSRPGTGDAGRPDRSRAADPVRFALLGERDGAPHRLIAAAARGRRPGIMELRCWRPARRRCRRWPSPTT